MCEQYNQTVEITPDNGSKTKQILSVSAILLSLGFVMLSVFVSWFFMFGFGAFFIIGMIYLQLYNSLAKEYTYSFSYERLVIAKKNVVNRQSRILCVLFEDVVSFDLMQGMCDDSDIVACQTANEAGVRELLYREDGKIRRLIFEPDDYMVALIREKLEESAAANAKTAQKGNENKNDTE